MKKGTLRLRFVIDAEPAPWATVSLAALRHRLSGDLLDESPGQGADLRVLRRHRRKRTGVPLQQMTSLRALDLDVSSQAAQRGGGDGDTTLKISRSGRPQRGTLVLRGALGFALGAGASLRMMTVEAGPPDERDELAFTLAAARSARLESELQALLAQKPVPGAIPTVQVRRGEIVEQILATVRATGADVLVIGYHRGGLPGIIEAGSTARRVVHTAPCAVLTIPL